MEFHDSPRLPEDAALLALRRAVPEVGQPLSALYDAPLVDYARHVHRPARPPRSRLGLEARALFADALRPELRAQLPPEDVPAALAELERSGVIQTGPHGQLMLDHDAFYTVIFSRIGLLSRGCRHYFWFTCFTNKLEVRPGRGAGWLSVAGTCINVFGLSRRLMTRSSAIAAPGPVRFALEEKGALSPAVAAELAHLRDLLGGAAHDSVPEAVDAANRLLWQEWEPEGRARLVVFAEGFCTRLVARHLEVEDGLLGRLLFEPRRRAAGMRVIERAARATIGSMLPSGTDFFWRVRDHRIRAMALRGGHLVEQEAPDVAPVPFERGAVIEELRRGALLPNVFLLFLAATFLPGFRALGGFFQIAYMPVYRAALLAMLDGSDRDERALVEDILADDNHGWGMHVLEEPDEVLPLIAQTGRAGIFPVLAERYARRSTRSITRNLELFRKHGRWLPVMEEALAGAQVA
ncbi:hypothetical protein [Sorangium sp. So ce394]|uniref:hypothetical protein n=1 Tax=Sorangium sp. So ce394 TaxID=3133310 RepID=UPI003F5B5C9D